MRTLLVHPSGLMYSENLGNPFRDSYRMAIRTA